MSTILTILLLTNSFLSTSKEDLHKFYMSVTEIEHNTQSQSLEITISIFTDDFETTLEANSDEKIRLGTTREHSDTDKYILAYLENNLEITVNNQKRSLNYIGKEAEINKTFCYIEIPNVDKIEKISVKNTLLFDLYDGQKNIVKVKYQNKKKSLLLDNNKSKGSLEF